MKKQFKLAEEEMVYVAKEILELKQYRKDSIAEGDTQEADSIGIELRQARSRFVGMTQMYALLAEECQNEVRHRIRVKAQEIFDNKGVTV